MAFWVFSKLAVSDFENGNLKITDVGDTPPPDVTIPLSPGERSCPWSITIHQDIAYVVGREGTAGTSTANCDNWRGLWKVDLANQTVLGFLPFGIKPRDVEYGSNDMVYVSDFDDDKVYVINPATLTIDHTMNVGDGPVGMALTPDATKLLVTAWNANLLKAYDLSNDQEIGSVSSGGVAPVDVFLSGNTAAVLNYGDPGTSDVPASLLFLSLRL